MPAPTVTEGEFVELWKSHGSPSKVASVIGTSTRAVQERRRAIEVRRNISLPVTTGPRVEVTQKVYGHLQPYEYKRRHNLGILDGQVIVFSDAHYWPGFRTVAHKALVKFIRDMKPRAVICNGDAFDGAQISRYPRIGWDSTPTVIDELKAVKERLGEVEEAAGRAKLVWPLGNHDARFENRLAQNAPQFEGVTGFHLKDHFTEWEPCWACWINDDTVVKHRMKGGIHATRNNTLNAGVNIVTGHLHQLKVTPLSDYNGNRYGVDTGTVADVCGPQFINYTEAGPLDWRSGFAVLTFHKGRLLMPQLVQKWDDKHVEYAGSLFDVSDE